MAQVERLRVPALLLFIVVSSAPVAHAQAKSATPDSSDARDANLLAYVELLRSDLRAQKVAVITEVMQFTEEEDGKFWPVYREYEEALAKINDDRIALVKEYAASFDVLTDAMADDFAVRALGLQARRHALQVEYYDRFKKVLSAKTAARFLQVEHQILLLLDLQIAASLPIASR